MPKTIETNFIAYWMIMIISWLFNVFMIVLYDDHKFKKESILQHLHIPAHLTMILIILKETKGDII